MNEPPTVYAQDAEPHESGRRIENIDTFMEVKMETIKSSKNVEFDVIYANGSRLRVKEGMLFGVEDESIIFHNGTSRPEVAIAVAEAACEVIGAMQLPEDRLEQVADNLLKAMKYGGSDE